MAGVRRRLWLLMMAGMAACTQGTGGDAAGPVVRDSAGVRIVESGGPLLGSERWVVDSIPLLQVGERQAGGAYDLFQVGAALRLKGGGLVMANGGSRELRFFDARGGHLRSVGGRGAGPGEFQNLTWLRRYRGDSLLAYDSRLRRLTVFDADGSFGRVLALGSRDGVQLPLGALEDGSIVGLRVTPPQGDLTGIIRRAEILYRLSPAGEVLDSLSSFAGREMFANRRGGDLAFVPIPHARFTSYATHEAVIFAGTNDTYEIMVLSASGDLEMRLRRPVDPEPATAADGNALIEYQLSQIDDSTLRERQRRVLDGLPTADAKPAYAGILADRAGYLWVQRYDALSEAPPTYDVFSPAGAWHTTVVLPTGVRPLDIGQDYLVAHWTDDLGVEYIRVLRLERRG